MDVGLPDIDGIEVTRQLRNHEAANPEGHATRILILTFNNSEAIVLAAFGAGADSYCMKDINSSRLVEALELTYEGHSWIDPAIARIVLRQTQSPASRTASLPTQSPSPDTSEASANASDDYDLTDRELEVLQLIVSGCNNAAIAEKLHITVGTVKTHVRNILTKLSASDRTQAAVRALRLGLVN